MDSDYNNSDEDIDDRTHAKLVRNVLNLNSKQYVKKPTRTEPTLNISEYDLVKSGKNLQLLELTQVLRKKGNKHGVIEKKIRKAGKKGKTLPKPLEKPQAERIRRTIGYEHTRLELDKWEPVVTANRVAQQIKFPLATKADLRDETSDSRWRMKSNLEMDLEAIQPKVEVIKVETEKKKFPMTLKELMERRKESAKLRAYQSYKEAKARRQNKIKSKKYHRIQRRERIKQQLKEFERLQKTDPRAALLKLDEIEKARAQERVSLRHKGTGKWARNKQIRAKYDKESRQVLAQQLAISRDLTQKQKVDDSDSEDGENVNAVVTKNDPSNPWINSDNIKVSKDVEDFVSGYRKYWEQKNNVGEKGDDENITSKLGNCLTNDVDGEEDDLSDEEDNLNDEEDNVSDEEENLSDEEINDENITNGKVKARVVKNEINAKGLREQNGVEQTNKKAGSKSSSKKAKQSKDKAEECASSKDLKRKQKEEADSTKTKKKRLSGGTSEWDVIDVDKELLKLDTNVQKEMQERYDKLKREIARDEKLDKAGEKGKKLKKPAKKKPDLALPKKATKPIIDEELAETTHKDQNNDIDKMKSLLDDNKNARKKQPESKPKAKTQDIDPEKFVRARKTTELQTEIPDLMEFDDNEEDADQRDVITEAFQDDDVAEDFQKEKRDDVKKNRVKDVDLTLPGWGAWGGKDIKVPARKKRRFIMKFNQPQNRRDKNKGHLIIKEGASAKLKPHLVTEVPFPFKTVKDYEASIRAPIGSTFVPENAHRKMIQPAVVTKMGAIIEPLTEDVLLRKKKG